MNHSSYKIFITKSHEAAMLISAALRNESEEKGYLSTGSGCVGEDCRIPALYHGDHQFYAMAEYKNGDDWERPKYDLTIC